jgi:IS605 OrfB family transposase
MASELILTYQTRLRLNEKQEEILQTYACLLSSVERFLYTEAAKGKTSASCKNAFLKIHGITARQFNACRVSLEGKIAACKASQEQAVGSLKQQIASLDKKVRDLAKKPSKHFVLHQKKRRLANLSHRLTSLEEDRKDGRVRLCFGGKKLFRAQFHLEKSGFSSHQEWQACWQAKRSDEFFALGSKDETAGNQTCTAYIKNGSLCLRLRLPLALEAKCGKYLEIENLVFAHGHEAVLASLNHPDGRALSYRFKKDGKSWRVFVSTALEKTVPVSKEGNGVIGIDLNADHIAYVETDRFGNPLEKKRLPWATHGKSKHQLRALTGDLCKTLIKKAKETNKPLVIEKLDFQKKKLSLKEKGCSKLSRLLSGFAYGVFYLFLMARAYKHGIIVHQVNPAFTSIIGRINYAERYGLSIHLAAAFCIARRYQKFSEAPCSPEGMIPDGKGGLVAFVLPVRNRTKHVWHFWGQVKKKLATVFAAHFRAIRNRSLSPQSSTHVIRTS